MCVWNTSCGRWLHRLTFLPGNSWGNDFVTGKGCIGCGPQEEFYACADIRISRRGGKIAHPTKAPITTLKVGHSLVGHDAELDVYLWQRHMYMTNTTSGIYNLIPLLLDDYVYTFTSILPRGRPNTIICNTCNTVGFSPNM